MARRSVFLLLLASSLAVCAAPASTTATYVGASACAICHTEIHRKWTQSRHSKMVQPATVSSVRGDFTRAKITLRGANYSLRANNGTYFITAPDQDGKPHEYRVDYTLGNRRIQHYLTTLPSGRVVVLPPSWDILRKDWFHNVEIADPDETSDQTVQVWNKNCFSCHVSQQEKNFDVDSDRYNNKWIDFGTNCERCHGPGSEHVKNYSAPNHPKTPARDIVLQTRLDPQRNTMVCAQCHSFRDIYVPNFAAGENYYDHFIPILEYDQPVDKDPAYWPDGRTRRFSNDALGLWQSECFLKGGVTCVGCHTDAHDTEIEKNPQLRTDANALCTHCHESIGQKLTEHTHHVAKSAGSSCVECHMPRTVLSIKTEIRDHSMSIPVPENTIRHAIPNACNECHKDRDTQWALKQTNEWYGENPRAQKWIRRADTFALARTGDPRSIEKLLAILSEPSEGPLVRANAAGYLSHFSTDPEVFIAFQKALADPEPLVRAVVALRMNPGPADRQTALPFLTRALADPIGTVRLGAAVSLVSLGIRTLPGEDGARFDAAKQMFRARAALNNDDAEQQLAAGKFFLLTSDPASATRAFQSSLKLDPEIPARYYLAVAYAQQGNSAEARKILEMIPSADPQYSSAQRLLQALTNPK